MTRDLFRGKARLALAAARWLETARDYERAGDARMASLCRRAAAAARSEFETGVAVCPCCLEPYEGAKHERR
jgi:hypothetical protein